MHIIRDKHMYLLMGSNVMCYLMGSCHKIDPLMEIL